MVAVMLRSSDNRTFVVDSQIAKQSRMISLIIEDTGEADVIPLTNVTGTVLSSILTYMHYHDGHPENDSDTRKWDATFLDVAPSDLFDIMLASHYMNIPSLLDSTCQTVADMIKGHTPEELRVMFGIKNDFTPEEEADVRREGDWAFS